jgi:hypothetical protein
MNLETWQGHWIWSSEELPQRNAFVRFRRTFQYSNGKAILHMTADSRYMLFLNGKYLGQGPVRAWPNHWRYDSYDLAPELREGENTLAVLVNHWGEGNFQYIPAPPGLLAQLELESETIASDASWLASPEVALRSDVPRISIQEAFEEQYDARLADEWTLTSYDDTNWQSAAILREALEGPHQNLEPRGIPFLTTEAVLPQRLVDVERVSSLPHRFTIYAKPYLTPDDFTSNFMMFHAYLATQVWSPKACNITFVLPHKQPGPILVNGELAQSSWAEATESPDVGFIGEAKVLYAHLREGWNSLLVSLRQTLHLQEFVICLNGPSELRFRARGGEDGEDAAWAVIGPFGLDAEEMERARNERDETFILAQPRHEDATEERGTQIWESGDVASLVNEPFFQLVAPEHLPAVDVFAQAYTDGVVDGDVSLENVDGLWSGSDWTTVHPTPDGSDVRLLLDWGQEVIGFHRFEISAPEGTILDCHNFEFIQPDGRKNFAEGMNNSFRYICAEGYQSYQTFVRRGFGYSYLIFRNISGPVRLRRVEVLFSSYPQSRRGSFTCSDAKLDRIWQVGAHTLRMCAEDTYTDCPTYEQTNWVGDARNEALVDWVINGDPRLWFRCLEQTGQSLERSMITESQVPSSWQNLLPAWSFLWMRSCREYLLFTGDTEHSRRLLDYVTQNVDGICQHLNEQGLFSIRAWNMFDWAAMDTPNRGVVTHNNCFAVHALRDVADLAQELGETGTAMRFRGIADDLSHAINVHLWNEEKSAYTDCLRDGDQSGVFSQQTQTVAFMSGVAGDFSAQRADLCREKMHHPPADFVKAGSPFFEFFLLEAYAKEARDNDFLDTIRRDWGFMIDMGASTFWEMWSGRTGRLTRSHCHGWSAAPTFFLSNHVLGVRPGGLGYSPALIEPHPGDLIWCRGTVPTPLGDIHVQWENDASQPFTLRVDAPQGVEIQIRLPREGTALLNGETVKPA